MIDNPKKDYQWRWHRAMRHPRQLAMLTSLACPNQESNLAVAQDAFRKHQSNKNSPNQPFVEASSLWFTLISDTTGSRCHLWSAE
jgi:hypothetical protein